jgi:STE24 endopeptidase
MSAVDLTPPQPPEAGRPPAAAESAVSLDAGRQVEARRYARIRRRLLLLDLGLGVAYVLAWLAFGWSLALKRVLLGATSSEWLLVLGLGAVFGAGYALLDLPLSYYAGFVLPHRFGLATETLAGWIGDQLKGLALSALLGGLMLEIAYALLRAAPETWWLWLAAVLLVFSVLLANLAPVLIYPLFFRFVPLGPEHADLVARLLRLAERAGTEVRGVYSFDMSRRTRAANAALTGLGRTRRILLGDTLLSEFTPDEIETVLAHELGHHVHRDIPLGIAVQSALTLGGLYLAAQALRWGLAIFGFDGVADPAGLPLFAAVLAAFGLVTLPLGNAFSRWRERRADEYALRATGKPLAYASALTRLANQNLAETEPEPWVEWLLYSHPALARRIARARAAAGAVAER